MTRLPVPVYN